ncbi:hypothetical protein PMAYCL1PPCAC_08101, partial [Pristionchus mayeri]
IRMLVFLLFLLPFVSSLDILMYVNVAGKSHLQFAEKLIELLNENGHTVDAVFGMLNSYVHLKGTYGTRSLAAVHFPGESPWGQVAQHIIHPFEKSSELSRLIPEPNKFLETSAQLCDLLLDSSEVAQLLSLNRYDLAMITGYDLCPFALAYVHKISPAVSFVPTPAYMTQYYQAGLPELPLYENIVFDARYAPKSSFIRRVFESLRTARERYAHHQASIHITEKFRARFGDDFPDAREIMRNVSLDFTNSHPLLEEPKPISFRLRYIGGIALPRPNPLDQKLKEMLDLAPKGNVIFSFGTQVGHEKISEELKRVFIRTFQRFPEYNFLWKFDGVTDFNASNIFNLDWLPQTDLLYDSRVVTFISHMGLNSFTEASFAGVPVVAIPLFADQVHNALRALALGTGKIVRKTEITEENLTRALSAILFDERYLNRAKELASMISAYPDSPQRTFLEGIEVAAKMKNLSSHFRLAGANHHYLVQIGWDVASFL